MKKIKLNFKFAKDLLNKKPKIKKEKPIKKVKKKTVNRREFVLIFFLTFMLEVYGLYTYLYMPIVGNYIQNQEKSDMQVAKLNRLIEDDKNKEAMKEELENKQYQLTRLKERLPNAISQENILLSLNEYAENSGLKIDSISFEDIMKYGIGGDVEVTDGTEAPVILNKGINVAYKAPTKAFFDFLVSLEKNPNKLLVTDVSLQSGEKGESLMGNFSLKYIAFNEINENLLIDINIPENIVFRDNPFESFGSPITDNDFADTTFHMLAENKLYLPQVSLGRQYKPETEIYGNGDNIDVKLTVEEIGTGLFKCIYQVGEKIEEREEKLMLKEGRLNFNILSHERLEEEKLVINVMVENNTDIAMDVVIYGDDMVRPIISMEESVGPVSVKRVGRVEEN